MISRTALKVVAVAAGLSLSGCRTNAQTAPEHRFEVSFRVTTDDGDGLAGVAIKTGSKTFGATDASGALILALNGSEGQTLPIAMTCPDEFTSPAGLSPLRLTRSRRMGADPGDATAISFPAVCTRQIRDVVLVVHAEHGETLPVLVDGKAVSSTDADGVSHVLLHFDRDVRSFGIVLDTSARRGLRPQNPSRNFDLTGRDAIVLFEPTLTPAPRFVAKQWAPVRHVPYRVD